MKKGDLSMQTIVIAVLALIVLAVLIWVFTTNLGQGQTSFRDCVAKGGTCVDASGTDSPSCPSGSGYNPAFKCDTGKKCCVGLI